MYIIVKSNTHPLIGNYYFKKTRESVTLKRKMKKTRLLLLLHVLHGDDSHHFLLDVGDLWVDLTDHVIDSSLVKEMRVFNDENNINNAAGWKCFKEDQSRAGSHSQQPTWLFL